MIFSETSVFSRHKEQRSSIFLCKKMYRTRINTFSIHGQMILSIAELDFHLHTIHKKNRYSGIPSKISFRAFWNLIRFLKWSQKSKKSFLKWKIGFRNTEKPFKSFWDQSGKLIGFSHARKLILDGISEYHFSLECIYSFRRWNI
jgi:hypothetical protein